jgi:hypothetical protein
MTIRLIESWKTCPVQADLLYRWNYQYGNGGSITSDGMSISGSQVSFCNCHFTAGVTTMLGFWFTPLGAFSPSVSNSSFMHLLLGGEWNTSNQLGFGIDPDGMLEVFQGDNFSGYGGTTLYTGTVPLEIGKKVWIETKYVSDTTTGSMEVRIDGKVECTLTGVNSAPRGVGLSGLCWSAGNNTLHLVGGMYVGDGDEGFLGPCNVERLYPVGWAGETDPVYTPTDNQFDSTHVTDPGSTPVALQPPSYNPKTIHAIQATRFVDTGPAAFFSMDAVNGPIPTGG